ncbi:amino acid adenylation domain-containing protein, partial [Longimicrobium sp.]|uniref:amino acid adenylation domain-containing protein n=1 Tax=Longimicrobium sp. TaxID=2029185 RepID=UPI002E37DD8D
GHFRRLLEQVAADPDRPVAALDLLDEGERRLLAAWAGADAPYPADACLHGLFEAQVARTPGAPALLYDGETLTYGALNARANRVAHHLRRLGVGPETRVGICLARSADLVAGILGILKAGGAYVPLDPAWPADRLAFMLADSAASVLLTSDATAGVLPAVPALRLVRVDADAAAIAREPAENPAGGALSANLAYLIYTSGSTGRPKGVAIQHDSAAAMLAWAWETYSAEELDGMLASTSVCFDMSVFELFAPLARGGRVILVENALTLPDSPHADEVRLIDTVPSAMRALLEADGIPAGARTVNLGGEPLPQDLVDALYARGVERVYDLYGPSEDTTFSTVMLRRPGGPVSIGRTLPNSRGWIVDAGLRLTPAGVPGELCLAGKGLTRGYLGRPALTAERFIPDPFATEPGGRMYRTGDRVRWRPDGLLAYGGRMDHQVKVRGFRVEPGEIEAALRRHPDVAEAAVVARPDDGGNHRLVAYVVGAAGDEALRTHLRQGLPEYMVPSVFVRLERLPLTPSGKVDRLALPAPTSARGAERARGAMTPMEEVLAAIWADVLKVEHVAPDDDFFHIGGHSLLATRVVARVQETLGVHLPLSALFQAPTVEELAGMVESARRGGAPALPPVVPVPHEGRLPLSWAQERLFFLDRLQPGLAFYNVPMAVWLGGGLDVPALERALGEVLRRHEVLRTTFQEHDGTPYLHVAPFTAFHLPVEDLSAAADVEAQARRQVEDEAARPFDLQAGPLFRARLLRLTDEDHVLLVSMHHAVSDEWSMGVLVRELSAGYAAAREGAPSPLAHLPVQYADYAVWQREQLAGALEGQLEYWRGRLAGAPALTELPLDHPRPPVQSHRGAAEPFRWPAGLLRGLEALGRAEGATLYMVMLGALQVLLSRYGDSDDVLVGSPITGRMRHETEGLMGFFANTLVLRTDLSGEPSFREVVRRARETALGAYDHQDVPFERLVEVLQPERSLRHSPLCQVMLLQGAGTPDGLELPGVQPRWFGGGTRTSKFDLTLAFIPGEEGMRGSMEYATDLFEADSVRRMLGHLERVVEQVVADPDRPVTALDLLGPEERRRVVDEWNRTDAPVPAGACVHHAIEAQAARTPDALAVVHGAGALTYRALNESANGLAHRLRALGVGPEVPVGICLERGPAVVAAMLAVLKAGGVYVPLDPSYPAARLGFMAADSGMRVLLTQPSLANALSVPDGVRVLHVDALDEEAFGEGRAQNPDSGVGPENLAYLLYTSGSTGAPKGVAMPHAALVNLVAWHLGEGVEPRATLQFSALSFDVSFQELATTLSAGGRLVLVDEDLRRDPDALLGYLAEERVERVFLPFVALQSLADAAAARTGTEPAPA